MQNYERKLFRLKVAIHLFAIAIKREKRMVIWLLRGKVNARNFISVISWTQTNENNLIEKYQYLRYSTLKISVADIFSELFSFSILVIMKSSEWVQRVAHSRRGSCTVIQNQKTNHRALNIKEISQKMFQKRSRRFNAPKFFPANKYTKTWYSTRWTFWWDDGQQRWRNQFPKIIRSNNFGRHAGTLILLKLFVYAGLDSTDNDGGVCHKESSCFYSFL